MTDSQVLKLLEFPAYCVRVLDNGLIAIAGGGGTSKTGVSNCIELGIIDYSNNDLNRAQFHSIHKFEPSDAIMKFTSFNYDRSYSLMKAKLAKSSKNGFKQPPITDTQVAAKNDLFIAAALNDSIEIYKIQPTIDKSNKNNNNLRQRNGSTRRSNGSTSSLSSRSNGINHNSSNHSLSSSNHDDLKASAYLKLVNIVKLTTSQTNNEDDVFDENRPVLTRKLSNLKTNEESIETLAVCNMPRNESFNEILLCAGTSKGNIIIWNLSMDNIDLIKSNKLKTFKEAHGKHDIDELQVNHDLHHLLTIGKDNRCIIWSLKKLAKLNELEYVSQFNSSTNNNNNIRMKHARYANNGQLLYTTYIPRVRGGKVKLNSFIQKWHCINNHDQLEYKPMTKHCIKNTILTSIQASKDGSVVCCGDYEGRVYLFDSNFETLINFRRQHSCVVTDLAFYHDTSSVSSLFNSNNKLILSLSIDRTLQCYTYLDTNNTFNNSTKKKFQNLCSMNTFKLVFMFIGLVLLFCYYFTHLE